MTRQWYSVAEAAQALGLHRETVRRRAHDGEIPGARADSGQWRIPASYIEPEVEPAIEGRIRAIECMVAAHELLLQRLAEAELRAADEAATEGLRARARRDRARRIVTDAWLAAQIRRLRPRLSGGGKPSIEIRGDHYRWSDDSGVWYGPLHGLIRLGREPSTTGGADPRASYDSLIENVPNYYDDPELWESAESLWLDEADLSVPGMLP